MSRNPIPDAYNTGAAAILYLLAGLAAITVQAQEQTLTTHTVSNKSERNLASELHWLRETDGPLDPETLAANPGRYNWRSNNANVLNLGLDSTPIWLGLRLETSAGVRRYLSIDYPPLDRIQFHLFRNGELIETKRTGDTLPFDQRPVPYHHFVFPLELSPEADYLVLIRVQTEGSFQVPLNLWTLQDFIAVSQGTSSLQMMFLGIMGALAVYNLLIYLAVRDPAYLWYVLYLTTFVLAQAAVRGLGFQYLWPGMPEINAISIPLFFSGALATAGFFTHQFLRVARHSRPWSIVIRGLAWIGVLLTLLSTVLDYQTMIGLIILFVGTGTLTIFIGACYLWWRGETLAKFYVIAWGIFLLVHVFYTMSKAGFFPANPVVEHSPQIGTVIQMLLLSFALAWRINEERERRQLAQAEALRVQREANEQLEGRVRERTEALSEAYDKLKKISELDGLTQLKNRPFFDHALEREWRRNTRETRTICLLMLDIDYFKQVNDNLGHQCGDEALRHIAGLCVSAVGRAGDVVARYGGEEFVILLPVTTLEGAVQIAEYIRVSTQEEAFYWNNERLHLSVSVGVTGCTPSRDRDYEWLVRHADRALYKAKDGGRNRTRVAVETDDRQVKFVNGSEWGRARD